MALPRDKRNLLLGIPDNIEDVFGWPAFRRLPHRSNDTEPRWIWRTVNSAVTCDWRVGRKRGSLSWRERKGAKHAISTTTNHAKAQQARYLGFDE